MQALVVAVLLSCSVAQDTVWTPPPASAGYNTQAASYCNLLGNALWFYDTQRSGNLSSVERLRVPWRNDSATADGADVGLDLSGGFYDAGDYSKQTYPLCWTLAVLSWAALDFGNAFDQCGQAVYLNNTLRNGFDWLIKAHPRAETLYVLIARKLTSQFCFSDGFLSLKSCASPGTYWGGDQNLPQPRHSFQINATSPGTDVAASCAAAFAAGALLYSGSASSRAKPAWSSATLSDNTYSSLLLSHAQQLHDFASSAPATLYQDSVPAVRSAYPSSSYNDELVFASAFLYLATNNASYRDSATALYQSSALAGSNRVLNWDSKTPALPLLLSQITGNESYTAELQRYLDTIIMAPQKIVAANAPGYTDGGLLYYSADSPAASLNPALNLAMLVSHYATSNTSYATLVKSILDYALGRNPMNIPYVVGVHPSSPKNPHSAAASGGSNISSIDSIPEEEAYIIYGASEHADLSAIRAGSRFYVAVIGGPDQHDQFFDIRSDYQQTEVALDYNAPLLSLAAFAVLNTTQAPFYASLEPKLARHPSRTGSGVSQGAIIAIAVLCTIATLLLTGGLTYLARNRLRSSKR